MTNITKSEFTIKASYDKGWGILSEKKVDINTHLITIDIDKLIKTRNIKDIVASLPPQLIYHSIKLRGLSDSLEVLPYLTRDQLIRILDYDVWYKDVLVPHRAFEWLRCFKFLGIHGICSRYKALDEEYQIALLQKYIEVYETEELEKLPENIKDEIRVLPCNTLFYRIKSDNPDIVSFIEELVESALATDIAYAYQLLLTAAKSPPNEAEMLISQFRRARLEEDGFVTYEESLRAFQPISLSHIKDKIKKLSASQINGNDTNNFNLIVRMSLDHYENFLQYTISQAMNNSKWNEDDALNFQQKLLYLANSLTTATHIEADDIQGLALILEQIKALYALGLEYLCAPDTQLALQVIQTEHPQIIFRTGLSLIYELQKEFLQQLSQLKTQLNVDVNKLILLQRAQKFGEILFKIDQHFIDILDYHEVEILKGLFNRFPLILVKSSDKDTLQNTKEQHSEKNLKFCAIYNLSLLSKLKENVHQILSKLQN